MRGDGTARMVGATNEDWRRPMDELTGLRRRVALLEAIVASVLVDTHVLDVLVKPVFRRLVMTGVLPRADAVALLDTALLRIEERLNNASPEIVRGANDHARAELTALLEELSAAPPSR